MGAKRDSAGLGAGRAGPTGHNGPMHLYAVGDGLTDEFRTQMGVHTLAEAKAHEAELGRR